MSVGYEVRNPNMQTQELTWYILVHRGGGAVVALCEFFLVATSVIVDVNFSSLIKEQK